MHLTYNPLPIPYPRILKALVLALLMIFFVPSAYGAGFTVKRIVEGYQVVMAMSRNPSVSSGNQLSIEIKDPSGKYATMAAVMVNYYMPPMPSMPPMNYKVKASPRGTGYNATMDLIMAGPWIIVVNANVDRKNIRVTVPIDVR